MPCNLKNGYLFRRRWYSSCCKRNEKRDFRGKLQESTGDNPADCKERKGRAYTSKSRFAWKSHLILLFTSIIGPSVVSKIIKMIMLTNYRLPIRQARVWSTHFESKFEFDHPDEQDLVFRNAIINLTEEDRQLPQITNLLPRRSDQSFFATETFEDASKNRCLHYGEEIWLKGVSKPALEEYNQMSGRAGRRDLDDRGIVIVVENLNL